MISIEQIDNLLKNSGIVLDQNGDKVGKVEQVFVGDDSNQPEWVTAKTGLFGHSETYIPLREAIVDGNDVCVPYDKHRIKDAPRTDNTEGHLQPEQEDELYRYYGLDPERGGAAGPGEEAGQTQQESGPQGAPQHDADRHVTDQHETGQQEPVRQDVGDGSYGGGYDQDLRQDDDAAAPAGNIRNAEGVRLRKYTVTEHVTMTVPVEREEVEVVPENEAPEGRPVSGNRQQTEDPRTVGDRQADQAGTAGAAVGPAGAYAASQAGSGADSGSGNREHHRGRAGDEQAQSEGFGENHYDQLRGPQSEDPQHPRGTAEERPADRDENHEHYRGGQAEHHRHRADNEQPHSEGFGENYYDQLRGPQSEDLQHPRGTAEERPADRDRAFDKDRHRNAKGTEDRNI